MCATKTTSMIQAQCDDFNLAHQMYARVCAEETPMIIVMQSERRARMMQALMYALSKPKHRGMYFPSWETLPYEMQWPAPSIISQRMAVRHQFHLCQLQWVVMSCATLMAKLPPTEFIMKHHLSLNTGDPIDPQALKKDLISWGYVHDDETRNPGSFAMRGGMMDLFPAQSKHAFRIEFFDDTIETIRFKTHQDGQPLQSSIKTYAIHEANPDDHKAMLNRLMGLCPDEATRLAIAKKIEQKRLFPGYQYHLCLYHQALTSWLTLGQDACWTFDNGCDATMKKTHNDIVQTYQHSQDLPMLAPNHVFLPPKKCVNMIQKPACFNHKICAAPPSADLKSQWMEDKTWMSSKTTTDTTPHAIVLPNAAWLAKWHTAETPKLKKNGLYDWLNHDCQNETSLAFIVPLEYSMMINTTHALIGLDVLHPESTLQHAKPVSSPTQTFESLQMKPGDLIAHNTHGIGQFIGIESHDQNVLCVIAYADDDKIYLPADELDQITLIHQHGHGLPLSKLGSKKWHRQQVNAIKKMADSASHLLGLYGQRASVQRPLYTFNTTSWQSFLGDFPYEDTSDQKDATQHIMDDLTLCNKPMERLLCGDVGFGKTELAMRAAWLVAQSGKQVMMLAPTTILAQQHIKRFQHRFLNTELLVQDWIGAAATNQKRLHDIREGRVDIIIGTHGLLSQKVRFEHLGLLIIDEEQKFGVKQKEKVKAQYPEVDILSLSATPIPRTLHLSMSKVRDISLLASPPENRLDVLTSMYTLAEEDKIKEAISREIQRGGQVYVCYNKVQALPEMEKKLQKWFPDISIAVAHGQMEREKLTTVMRQFYLHHHDVLLSSSIIDSGLDHANANTIIVYRADLFGLSQLHQLRGRVGRGAQQGYAYFFVPEAMHMSKQAIQRMAALQRFQKLGSGFSLAMEDLEIRGTGNILGENQSGHIEQIGFQRYMALMQQTMDWLKNNPDAPLDPEKILSNQSNTSVYFDGPTLIPEDYICDPQLRLEWYANIARARSEATLEKIIGHMYQKFGRLPQPLVDLIEMASIRCMFIESCVHTIKVTPKHTCLTLHHPSEKAMTALIQLSMHAPHRHQLQPPDQWLIFTHDNVQGKTMHFDTLKAYLSDIAAIVCHT